MQHSYRTKGWAKRLGAMAMTLVMLFGLMAAGLPQAQAVTQDDINNLKSQAASLSSQKADIQKKLDKLSNSKNSAINEKLLLEQKINVLRSEIAVSEQAIAEYGEMITQKESELAAAKEKEAKYYEAFCERVRSMEERGNVSYWSVIFNASSFSDLLDQVNAISEVMDYDNEIMDQLAKARRGNGQGQPGKPEGRPADRAGQGGSHHPADHQPILYVQLPDGKAGKQPVQPGQPDRPGREAIPGADRRAEGRRRGRQTESGKGSRREGRSRSRCQEETEGRGSQKTAAEREQE